jgi:lipopolysaccharide transport system ATP-binding protein
MNQVMARPVLRLDNVGVFYQRPRGYFRRERYWALRDISFSLYRGESFGVIGRNGAGKSTLLKVLAGIIEPDKGRIWRTELRADLLSLRLGFVPHLNGRENAILSGILMGLRRRQMETALGDIAAFAELEEFMEQPLRTYSAGMKARLGFAVAFHADPDILLVDEALGVGDADFRRKSTELMRQKIRSDKTVVVVSHSASVIRELCDRVVWIERGQTRQVGRADEVLANYDEHSLPDKRARERHIQKA